MAKSKQKYPKQLYVGIENEGLEDEFYLTSESTDGMEVQNDSRMVAIYQLVRVVKVVNKTEVV